MQGKIGNLFVRFKPDQSAIKELAERIFHAEQGLMNSETETLLLKHQCKVYKDDYDFLKESNTTLLADEVKAHDFYHDDVKRLTGLLATEDKQLDI